MKTTVRPRSANRPIVECGVVEEQRRTHVANTFTVQPACRGGMPITFADGLLYLGPFAFARA